MSRSVLEKLKKERKSYCVWLSFHSLLTLRILAFPCRERSSSGFTLGPEIRREKSPTPRSPTSAWLPGLCGLLLQCFLLFLHITLPSIILCHRPALSLPIKVSPGRHGINTVPGPECVPSLWQPRRQPHSRAGSHIRWKAPVYQPRDLQSREGQTET